MLKTVYDFFIRSLLPIFYKLLENCLKVTYKVTIIKILLKILRKSYY